MAIFVKNLRNHKQGEFVNILKFTLAVIFVIFFRKCPLRLKNESSEISRNSAQLQIGFPRSIFFSKMDHTWIKILDFFSEFSLTIDTSDSYFPDFSDFRRDVELCSIQLYVIQIQSVPYSHVPMVELFLSLVRDQIVNWYIRMVLVIGAEDGVILLVMKVLDVGSPKR